MRNVIKKRCVFFYWDLCLILISPQMSFIREQEEQPKENSLLKCSRMNHLLSILKEVKTNTVTVLPSMASVCLVN